MFDLWAELAGLAIAHRARAAPPHPGLAQPTSPQAAAALPATNSVDTYSAISSYLCAAPGHTPEGPAPTCDEHALPPTCSIEKAEALT